MNEEFKTALDLRDFIAKQSNEIADYIEKSHSSFDDLSKDTNWIAEQILLLIVKWSTGITTSVIKQDVIKKHSDAQYNSLTNLQRLEAYELVKAVSPANELRDSLWQRSQSPQQWIAHVIDYTISTAMMSMAGYVIGLGDRHPSNIMIQRHTGRIVHIDFGESFDSAALRKKYPEHVPFRMTRMIVNALDTYSTDSIFRYSLIQWLQFAQSHKKSMFDLFEKFFYNNSILYGYEESRILLNKISQVMSCYLIEDDLSSNIKQLSTPNYVDYLIKQSKKPSNFMKFSSDWDPLW